ncbi:MAG TPA: choice-of-anchor J domain-containing protein, partial [Candidatus Cloacimonadota bacterium]|nr:choice-of-anchor J domain-containing protein [Candidatus Cloacimonadota bacterium]
FNARQGDGAWNATTAASANNQYVILNDVNYPASGLTFTFTYPVANAAPNPANLVSPADGATLVSPFTTLNWLSGGGLPDGFRLNFGTNNPPTNIVQNLDLQAANSYTPDPQLNVSTTYYWQIVPYNAFGNAINCPVWSFTTHGDATVNSLPYTQHWDAVTAPELPFDWSAIVQATSTSAYVRTNTTSPHSAPNNIQMANSSDASATLLLISPQIGAAIPMNSIRVKAWVRPVGSTYTLEVGVMTNPTEPATFELVQTLSFTNTTYTEHAIPLSSYAGTGRFIAFRHGLGGTSRTIYIDEITFEEIAPNDLAAISLGGNTTPSVGAAASFHVNVLNNGTATQTNYQVKLFTEAGLELASVAGTPVSAGETIGVQIPFTPSTEGPIGIYGKVFLAGDVNATNDQTPVLNLIVQPAGIMSVTIGEGNLAEGVPYEFYFRNSIFQTLYYQNEIGMFGNISSLTFYNNFVTDLVATPIKLWLGTTALEDLSAGWVDPTTLTLVYDGTMNFPAGTNTITIPLQTPYNYAGGNLVLYANRPYDANYYSSSDNFAAQTVGTNRARKLTSDSTTYDPMAPSAAGTLSGTFPKTTILMTPLSPDPLFAVSPSEKDFGDVILGYTPSQDFRVLNVGGGTLTVNSISISGSPFFTLGTLPTLPAQLETGENAIFNVTYAPTTAGEHTATITITDDRRLTHTVELSGTGVDTTIYELSYSQNFDDVSIPALPLGWNGIYQATATTGYVKTVTTSPHSTPNCVAMYNPTDINTIAMLVAPPLANSIAVNNVRVKLWGKGNNYSVKVGVMSNPADPATFTEIQTLTFTSAWAQYQVSMSSYTGQGRHIVIKHANNSTGQTIYLDTIEFEMMGANDLAATAISGATAPSVGSAASYTVSVYNNGTAEQSTYSVKLFDGSNVELATAPGSVLAPGATADIALSWTPTVEGPTSVYGKVILDGDINTANDTTAPMTVSVQPAGVFSVTVGSGDLNEGVPWEFFYKNSLFQCLYYPNEMGIVGNITAISFYNNFVTNLTSTPVKLWLGITTAADLSAGWVDPTSLTLVYDGTLNFPTGANTIIVPLQTPFAYPGGNLVLYANRPMDTQYYSSSDDFQAQTIGNNRARKLVSDSTTYDPMAPSAAGTLTGTFPKTTFIMTPMTGDPVFMVSPEAHNFGDVNLGGHRNQNFTITNAGGGTLGITNIAISGSATMTLSSLPTLPASLATGETAIFTVTYTPNGLNTDNATVTITDDQARSYSIGGKSATFRASNRTDRETHNVALTGTGVNDITIGDGSGTARMPMDFFYKNSLYENIYTADELGNFTGMITGLKFYNQFTSNLTAMPVKIWLGSTLQDNLTADWIPAAQLTLVFDGTVDFPSGENMITINFPEPYMHLDGGNLVMMVNRPMDTEYYSSTNYFKTQTGTAGRARNMYSDSTVYDPMAPTGGSTTGIFPKTSFVVIPGGVGDISGTVTGAGDIPLADVQVTVNGRPYSAVTDASGQFFIPNVLPGNYAVSFSYHGYVDQTINIVLEEDETEIMNVNMSLMAQVSVTGTILASDTGTGIAGANIVLTGYENYSGTSVANGTFTIPAVFANHSYQYTIAAAGYSSQTGTIEVGAVNYAMGNITMSEIAYAPHSVQAELNGSFDAVNISWTAPDPNAIEITEGFEAATFPPSDWTQAITNQGPANSVGVLPTWCSLGTINISGTGNVSPTEGTKQAGLWWDYTHQDEWLITPTFGCPPDAHLSFDTYVQLGSENNDHYYVKISTDNGSNWTVIWDATLQPTGVNHYDNPITLDLSSFAGNQVQLAFHADDPPSDDGLWYTWFIDNIYIGNFMDNIRFAESDLFVKNARTQTGDISITPDRLTRGNSPRSMSNQSLATSGSSTSYRSTNRALVGYKVWRLAAGQEANEATWVSLSDDVISTLNTVDDDWSTLVNGTYRWAVKAVYTSDVMSMAVMSNPL